MDWLTFTSNLINSLFNLISKLAWPTVVILIFYLGKDKVFELLPALRTIKYDKFQAEFEAGTTEAVHKAEEVLPDQDEEQDKDYYQNLREELMVMDPISSISTAWNYIDKAIRNALERTGIEFKRSSYTPTFHMQKLLENKLINPEQFELFVSMRNLRNRAVHSTSWYISPSALKNYIESSLNLLSFLDSIEPELDNFR